MNAYPLPALVKKFFNERLIAQMLASVNTVASYRDTFRMLLSFATRQLGKLPTDMLVTDIDADLVAKFLVFIEDERGNSVRTRNLRRTAIRSFFQYVSVCEPALLHHCQQILAIPPKRFERRIVDFLERDECAALAAAPDIATRFGRRDRAMLLVMMQTGVRVSELIGLTVADAVLEPGVQAHIFCQGKGRKHRTTPLRDDVKQALQQWLNECPGAPHRPLFVSSRGGAFSRDGIERIVRKHAAVAAETCPSILGKRVSPHSLRHSAAMELLRNGCGCTIIALWLGHESVETTQRYLHADLQIKKEAMDRTRPHDVPKGVYQPADGLLAFLEAM